MAGSKRLFVCIELPDATKDVLTNLDPQLAGVHWLRRAQMHLTVSFLGDVDAESVDVLRAKLTAIRVNSFFLRIHGVGTFPAKGTPKIVWIGIGTGHPHLFQLHKRTQEAALAAHIEPDLRPWRPHITLARCTDETKEREIRRFVKANENVEIGFVRVTSFALCSSRLTPAGSFYTRELIVALSVQRFS